MTHAVPPPGDDVSTAESRRQQVSAAEELMIRTSELPDDKPGLMTVLGEYRWMVLYLMTELGKRVAA